MWPSFPVPPCCRRVWCVAGLPLATRLLLLSAEVGISAVYVHAAVWSSRLQLNRKQDYFVCERSNPLLCMVSLDAGKLQCNIEPFVTIWFWKEGNKCVCVYVCGCIIYI